ncbi:MAG: feruloyl-CoA synthase [Rhodobacteraceae bacterium]|nr:feruloyl-CoA synthase [Paracoccaceae bacterium]
MLTIDPDKTVTAPGFLPHRTTLTRRGDGSLHYASVYRLPPVAEKTGNWLHHWAETTPDAIFIAERSGAGWRELSYAETLEQVRALAAALLGRGLGPDRPVAVLSGNGVDHGLIALAAQYAGIPMVPVTEQYSLIPGAHDRLIHILRTVEPGLIFVADAGTFAEALALPELAGIEIVAARTAGAPGPVTPLADLLKGDAGVNVDAAYAHVGPQTIAKLLFTSGSTSNPKGVPTTHRMLCVNQAQIGAAYPFLLERAPKIVDWLPWNHVFGGSHNFNMMLAHGGSLYVDDGKPTKAGFARTLENLSMHTGTMAFNVPMGYAMLLAALRGDATLRRRFFADLDLIFYAGASLPLEVWQGFEQMCLAERGSLPFMGSSWGMTETAPATLIVHEPVRRSGIVGVPVAGAVARLIPTEDGRYELRVKGPNITAGYYKDPAKTAELFDPDGFMISGDAVRFVDPADPDRGLQFDGRISEDFKLQSGTWVHATKLRVQVLEALSPWAGDIVITGHDRAEVGILVFPNRAALDEAGVAYGEAGGALVGPALGEALKPLLAALAERATGSSTRIVRALVLAEPPSITDREITDKGSLNARTILTRRAALLDRLYSDDPATIRL